ncbi:MAG TPA: FGGY-family carbohydrate kinase [Firmicutes bacterium]|nr:FGGY-family carbohydrate kinase [Bacillota bacterium]
MRRRLLLGIDIGTSGCKLAAFDFEGQVAGTVTMKYKTYYPHFGYVEQDAGEWWRATCDGIQAMIRDYGIDPGEIAAVGVAGQSWSCLPVDEAGVPLRNTMIWLDRRAVEQARWMKEKLGEDRLIALNGNPVDPAYIVPKMLWLKENEPEVYNRAHKFLQSNAFIVFKLTGIYSQDYSQGYGFHFFNISKGAWDEGVAGELGLSPEKVAPIYNCHEVVGEVTRQAAGETGLCEGTPVVAGGLDAACCTLGAGVIRPGQTQEQGGQAGGMSIQVDQPLIHPKLILSYHVLPDQWLLQGGTVGGAGTLKWFDERLGAGARQVAKERGISSFEVMSEEAGQIKPGSDGLIFLPYMAGERSPIWNSKARGVFFGLSYDKTEAHIIRSIMEGVGYSLLHNLDTAEEVKAYARELVSVGGASNSRVWTQIKADITGRPIHVPSSDHATTLGAAMLAGMGVGVYKDFEEAVNRTVHIQRTHIPDESNHRIYRRYYELYIELYNRLKDCFDVLHELSV